MPTVMSSSVDGELLTLADARAQSRVQIAPQRGAIVTSFRVGARELLYLDESTLRDPAKNVRGGIPILFPSPGKLEADTWQHAGQHGSMKQHGFARNLPWDVVSTGAHAATEATLSLTSNAVTRAQFPWDFRADFSFALEGARLRVSSRVENTSAASLPFALGYHPYFLVTDKARARVDTRATRAFDNVTKQITAFNGFDFTAGEVDLHLLDHGSSASALHFGDGARIELRCSPDFSRWVVWTLAGKDFICLEPWTAPGNALNTGDGLFALDPGAVRESRLDIEFVA
jgi:galactose mutarotase-like enzyme